MNSIKQILVILVCLLLYTPVVAQERQLATPSSDSREVTIIIQQQHLRITAPASAQEVRLEVFNQAGEMVYDSGLTPGPELSWALQNASGEAIPSGLYAYTLSVKEANAETPSLRRGHLIVERGRDRDPQTDRLWVTSQGPVGAETSLSSGEMTASTGPEANVVGARIARSLAERGRQERDTQGRLIARQDDQPVGLKEGPINISGVGTTNRITKWSDGPNGVVGDSTLSEVGGNIGIGTTTPTTGLDYRHTLAPFLTRDIGTTNFGTPQSAIQIGVTNTASRNVGVGPSFLFFSDNSAGQKQFLGRLSAAWENPTAGQEAGAISFNVRANSADTGALTERMRITSVGNVGIGTPTPLGQLHVRGASPVRILGDVATLAGAEYVDFMARNSPFSTDMGGMRIQRQSATGDVDTLLFAAASGSSMSEVMRVKGNGNVGIGTTNPLYKLHVTATGNHTLYAQSDIGIGVWGQSASNSAVYGQSASGYGVQGLSASGTGVYGVASATTGTAPGVYGETKSGDPAGIGVFGLSNNGRGVQGNSNGSGTGVFGFSNTGTAIFGNSNVNDAIVGTAHVGGKSGVYGLGNNGANGLAGISDSGVGVFGTSSTYYGVHGKTANGYSGVWGESTVGGIGVEGSSLSGYGVFGTTGSTGFNVAGVYGEAYASSGTVVGVVGKANNDPNGTGVAGFGRAVGGYFQNTAAGGSAIVLTGNAVQDRNSGGMVKAMALIDPFAPAGQQIVHCYNSQATGSAISTPPCGFTYTVSQDLGFQAIDFGFKVDDRFTFILPSSASGSIGANINPLRSLGNIVDFYTFYITKSSAGGDYGQGTLARLYIIVF